MRSGIRLAAVATCFFAAGIAVSENWDAIKSISAEKVQIFRDFRLDERSANHAQTADLNSLPAPLASSSPLLLNRTNWSLDEACPIDEAIPSHDGVKRVALIVGISDYESAPDLPGPVHDAERIYQLLTNERSFDIPEENICVLLNEDATLEAFRTSFKASLIDRVAENSVAIVYFAGMGSTQFDESGDEVDLRDETFLFYDAQISKKRGITNGFLSDDEWTGMLTALNKAAQNVHVTTIFDTCHQATSTRNLSGAVRCIRNPVTPRQSFVLANVSDSDFTAIPGRENDVYLAAAEDGTSAWELSVNDIKAEKPGGVFTYALVSALTKSVGTGGSLTYEKLWPRMLQETAALSYNAQTPILTGASDATLFRYARSISIGQFLVLENTDSLVTLSGYMPTPGLGPGAELDIYPASSYLVDEALSIKKASAIVVGVSSSGTIEATIYKRTKEPIEAGDIAVITITSIEARRSTFSIRPKGSPRGVNPSLADVILARYDKDSIARRLFDLSVADANSVQLVQNAAGHIQLLDITGSVRKTFLAPKVQSAEIIDSLGNLARQNSMKGFSASAGPKHETDGLIDNYHLQVSIKPRTDILDRAANFLCRPDFRIQPWRTDQKDGNTEVPLCAAYEVFVKSRADTPGGRLQIGGLFFTSDGKIISLPDTDQVRFIEPGQTVSLGIFQALPPLDIGETIMVFGTQVDDGFMEWERYNTTTSARRSRSLPSANPLASLLDAYVDVVPFASLTRDIFLQALDRSKYGGKSYALTTHQLTTRAHPECDALLSDNAFNCLSTYTDFDIRPYLADEANSYSNSNNALNRLLLEMSCLSRIIPKRDYECLGPVLDLPPSAESLAFIWQAFASAGIRVANDDQPFDINQLATTNTSTLGELVQCENGLRTGDILVHYDEQLSEGRATILVDSDRMVAWGKFASFTDRASFQPILPDRLSIFKNSDTTLPLEACWRHVSFEKAYNEELSAPGQAAIAYGVCRDVEDCGLTPISPTR